MILCEDGSVFGFGHGAHGQLGTGYVKNFHTPQLIKRFAKNERVVQVELGSNHSLALTECGSVYSAGSSKYGQLGHGNFETSVYFTKVESLPAKISSISAGGNHSWAIQDENEFKVQSEAASERVSVQGGESSIIKWKDPSTDEMLLD